jgi:hypothetical protein
MNLGGTMPCRSLIASNSQPKTQKKKRTRAMRTTNHIPTGQSGRGCGQSMRPQPLNAKLDREQFLKEFARLGARRMSEQYGMTERNVYERRRRLEKFLAW